MWSRTSDVARFQPLCFSHSNSVSAACRPPPPPPPLTLPNTPLHFKLSCLSVSLGLSICLYAYFTHPTPLLCVIFLSPSLSHHSPISLSLFLSLPHSWANLSVSQSLCLSLSVFLSLSISPLPSFSFPRFRLAPQCRRNTVLLF